MATTLNAADGVGFKVQSLVNKAPLALQAKGWQPGSRV